MFLDIMEPKAENYNSSLEKTLLILWSQISDKIAKKKVHKMTKEKNICKIWTSGG